VLKCTRLVPCVQRLTDDLDTCALNLLNSLLGSGASTRAVGGAKPVPVPPASHLALINTLIIHPLQTTRADKPELLEVSSLALDYLRSLLTVVGPVHADLRTAFQFVATPRYGRRNAFRGRDYDADSDMTDPDSDGDQDRLQGRAANEGALWACGQDFWSTVGWAFNCSALHSQRWRYWKAWLDYMLDVLEYDWDERARIDRDAHERGGMVGEQPVASRRDSLLVSYMNQKNGRQSGNKAILKALVADGSSISSSTFPEVFDRELRGPKTQSKKRKRERILDLENDKFGDYFDDESISSGVSEPPTPQKPHQKRPSSRTHATFGATMSGLAESVPLRLRLFGLVSAAMDRFSTPNEVGDLYDDFSVAMKQLPLPIFSAFVSQRWNPLSQACHISLCQGLFALLLPSSYKHPRKVDPDADANGVLSMPILEHCYVGYPANTVMIEDNAKLSLVVESAIQLLWASGVLKYTDSFAEAVEAGIAAREAKVQKKRTSKSKTDPNDALAREVLGTSTHRIRVLLDVLKTTSDEA
jgi:hypothetical protein